MLKNPFILSELLDEIENSTNEPLLVIHSVTLEDVKQQLGFVQFVTESIFRKRKRKLKKRIKTLDKNCHETKT